MCRVTIGETPADEALQRLQQELEQLQLQQPGQCAIPDFRGIPGCKGSGPRLFCGHVPKEATEDLVRAHFSRWGTVTDVYFPRHKKTLKRRPFCFVTFACTEAAERALAESPLNICGIPIKNLTMVEDRDAYYRTKHANTRAALLQALQNIGNAANGQVGPDQLQSLAALLATEGVTADAIMALLPQGGGVPPFGALQMDALLASSNRFPTGSVPPDALPSMLSADSAAGASMRMSSAGLYNGYPQMNARLQQQGPTTFPQQNGRFAPGPSGFGAPVALSLDAQLQQALLAQRVSLQQQAASTAPMQAPPASAAFLQQFGGLPQMTSGFAPQPQFAPAPQLFPGIGNWGGLAGQQPLHPTIPMMAAPPMGLAPSASSSRSSGSVTPQNASGPQMSLDEALAALSKLKAAQQAPMSETMRHSAGPSTDILAGLGSPSTFTTSSPALSLSPNLSSSPHGDNSLLACCTASLEMPPRSIWATATK